jgi:segregation and condensation protein A
LSSDEPPYWLKQPYAVLFDLIHLHRVKPWDVNLGNLLDDLLGEMRGRGYIDFSVSGTALLSSAILLRMKSELILKMEEPPKPPLERPTDFVPPPLAFPLRYESTTTSVEEVIRGLLEVLNAERLLPASAQISALRTPEVFEQVDDFLVKIEENLKLFLARLVQEAGPSRNKLSFLKLLGKGDGLAAVRMFIMLLFLAVDGKLWLAQQVEFGDIDIELREDGNPSLN